MTGQPLTARSSFDDLPEPVAAGSGVVAERRDTLSITCMLSRNGLSSAFGDRFRSLFGLELPRGPQFAAAGGTVVIGIGPGRWLLINEGEENAPREANASQEADAFRNASEAQVANASRDAAQEANESHDANESHEAIASRDANAAHEANLSSEANISREALASGCGEFVSLTDQSDGYAVLRLSGPRVRETLAKIVPLDLHPRCFRIGDAHSTVGSHIAMLLWRSTDTVDGFAVFDIAVPRSLTANFWRVLSESAAEFGLQWKS